jgi:hypothetical protein
MEEHAEVKKAVDEAQAYYDAQDKREWVKWAGKTLMLRLHAQMAMEQADTMRAEQDAIDEERIQAERAEHEQERVVKEAELDEKEEEYIWQMNAKKIDEGKFRELVNELDLERSRRRRNQWRWRSGRGSVRWRPQGPRYTRRWTSR